MKFESSGFMAFVCVIAVLIQSVYIITWSIQLSSIDFSPIKISVMSKTGVIVTQVEEKTEKIRDTKNQNLWLWQQRDSLFRRDANNQTLCVSMSPLGHRLMRSDP